jgi:hypothetical protein
VTTAARSGATRLARPSADRTSSRSTTKSSTKPYPAARRFQLREHRLLDMSRDGLERGPGGTADFLIRRIGSKRAPADLASSPGTAPSRSHTSPKGQHAETSTALDSSMHLSRRGLHQRRAARMRVQPVGCAGSSSVNFTQPNPTGTSPAPGPPNAAPHHDPEHHLMGGPQAPPIDEAE